MTYPRKLPVVLSRDEAARLLQATTCLKHQAALSVAYGAGLRVAEVAQLKVSDIDSERMLIRVERGKGEASQRLRHAERVLEWRAEGASIATPCWPLICSSCCASGGRPDDSRA